MLQSSIECSVYCLVRFETVKKVKMRQFNERGPLSLAKDNFQIILCPRRKFEPAASGMKLYEQTLFTRIYQFRATGGVSPLNSGEGFKFIRIDA